MSLGLKPLSRNDELTVGENLNVICDLWIKSILKTDSVSAPDQIPILSKLMTKKHF